MNVFIGAIVIACVLGGIGLTDFQKRADFQAKAEKIHIHRLEVKKCIGEQIEVARQNWDTVVPSERDDAEFVAQDQLRDFIMEVCLEELP